MLAPASTFHPELYRGWLMCLARAQWNDVLLNWGEPSDLVQQTILEAHEKQKDFTGNSPNVYAAWLKGILLNNLLDANRALHRKKRDSNLKRSLEAALDESSSRLGINLALDDPSPSALAAAAEQLNLLSDALAQLPPDQLEAVTLHHLRGLSLEAAAAQMGRTQPSVAGLLRRGLKRLGNLMSERGCDEQRSG
jgi:RNA polymerase sigma-70 factor (ECF subfamily)